MRRTISSQAQRLATRATTDSIKAQSPSPFICANCRRTALQTTRLSRTQAYDRQPRRVFSTTSTTLQDQPSTDPSPSPQRETTQPPTHYDLFPQTFPTGPPPSSPFTPDLRQLRREYLQLQAKFHPDRAPASQKRQAEAASMRLNEAYKTLQDPLRRARYLLSQRGIDMEDESAQTVDDALLLEVMELREAVDEAEDEAALGGIRKENEERIRGSVEVLERAFAEGDVGGAVEEAVRLRYWTNVEESIRGWEEGRGGGVLHH